MAAVGDSVERRVEFVARVEELTGRLAARAVLDLGCGRQALWSRAYAARGARVVGIELDPGPYFQAQGCELCEGRGYQGRLVLAEILVATESITSAVMAGKSRHEVEQVARSEGMETLLECGVRHAREGRTSLEEVLRVVG